jgi:pimeloyl-ACP methyl ester carboxylesterase
MVAERISGCVLRVMPGTAHLPAFEQPEEFAAVLQHFLSDPPV